MNPEILLEQIIGYTIGASELIPHIREKADKKYDFALLPYGPHFYTGILQSAGYLLLSDKKNVLFILPQATKDDEIVQIEGTIGPLFGKKRILQQQKKSWKTSTTIQQDSLEIIIQHLLFLDTISQAENITCLAVGENISFLDKKKLSAYIHANIAKTNVIFLTNVPGDQGQKKAKQTPSKQGLLSLFHHITKENKKTIEVIAYANAGDFEKNKGKNMKYACMMA